MNLVELLNLKKKSIVSIVGAGGKTSLMFDLVEELRADNKVLVTTTTRIFVPEKEQFDFFALHKDGFDEYNNSKENGVYVYGETINDENKLKGLECNMLEKQIQYFDYILIEADGSKRKALKGWAQYEPVIVRGTDITIGLLSLETIGAKINSENIHRLDKFIEITDSKEGDVVSIDHILSLVFHENGLFKDSLGQRVLFINKVDGQLDLTLAEELIGKLNAENKNYISKIIVGSLKYGKIYD